MVPEVDDALLRERGYLYAVADGMGGHGDGHKASQASLVTLYRYFYGPSPVSLPEAIQLANMEVRRLAMQPDNDSRMGTTLVAALFHGEMALVAHVGDSRAYVVRDWVIQQITRDHTTAQEQNGAFRGQHLLTRAIGSQSAALADYTPVSELRPGDTFALCSDGLTNLVADAEIAQVLTGNRPDRAAEVLVQLANERGGYDNVTVLVIRVRELPFWTPDVVLLAEGNFAERSPHLQSWVLTMDSNANPRRTRELGALEPAMYEGAARGQPAGARAQERTELIDDQAEPEPILAWLIFTGQGPRSGEMVRLAGTSFLVGRAGDCDLVLDDGAASRQHARIRIERTGAAVRFVIHDLATDNGTFVNGAREGAVELKSGDTIRIGRTELTFKRLQ